MRRRLSLTAAVAVVVMTGVSASAQTADSFGGPLFQPPIIRLAQTASVRRRPPARKPKLGVRVYGLVERETMRAAKSFEAVLGTSRLTHKGVGGDVVNIWKGAFARASFAQTTMAGQRVFVTSTMTVIPLSVPLTVKMTPIEIGGGWRFAPLDRGRHLVPYVGAAGLTLRYQETSQFSESGEDTDTRFTGSTVFGGLDVGIKFVRVAVEGLYRHVPRALGASGVSQSFSENNLGGGVIRIAFGIGF